MKYLFCLLSFTTCFANCSSEIKASYLYWGVQEDALGFAIENVLLGEKNAPPSHATIKTHDSKWNSGVRLEGIWSDLFRFQWTRFQTSSQVFANGCRPNFPTVGASAMIQQFQDSPFVIAESASSCWNICVNEFALDLQTRGCESGLRPFFGIFAAKINQTQLITYFGIPENATFIELGTFSRDGLIDQNSLCRKNHFWGIGPRVGFNIDWTFCNCFSLISTFNASLLSGRFDIDNCFSSHESISPFSRISVKEWRPRPMISDLIGLKWDKKWGRGNLTVSLSYEIQYWWQQFNASSNFLNDLVTGEGRWGDLSLQGLVATVGASF